MSEIPYLYNSKINTMRILRKVMKSFVGCVIMLTITMAVVSSCGKDDEPIRPPGQEVPDKPTKPDTPDNPEPESEIKVTMPTGMDDSVDFGKDADRLSISISANFSAPYELLVTGDHDWLYFDKAKGSLSEGTSGNITLYANRRGLQPGVHACKVIVATEKVKKEIPVEIEITEFVPFGSMQKVTSCDSRLSITFIGFYKRDGLITLRYKITNKGNDIRGLKLWTHPNYTYFTDDAGSYDKNTGLWSIWGDKSGTGDLMTPLPAGESIACRHEFPAAEGVPVGLMNAHLMVYNYGTGDWSCAGKYIDFTGLECEDLDNFKPDYRPTPPPAPDPDPNPDPDPTPEPDPQITTSVCFLDFNTNSNKLAFGLLADRDVHYYVTTSESWLVTRQKEGDLEGGKQIPLEFMVNRMNITAGEYVAEIIITTPYQKVVIPVYMVVTEFVPYGRFGSISFCDSRLPVTFNGCYKSGNDVTLMFFIRNDSGKNISGLKLWQHPNFTYFVDDLGNRYTKDTGTYAKIGSASGTGDLTTRLDAKTSIHCSVTIHNVNRNAKYLKSVVLRAYNYGTGDFECTDKEIIFTDVHWTNLDTMFD